jgi:hypothetical protein
VYIRVTRGRLADPAKYDDLVGMHQAIRDAITRLPGCQSYQSGGDRAAGTTIAVSTWDTAEHAQFSRSATGEVLVRLQAIGLQLDPPEIYEAIG